MLCSCRIIFTNWIQSFLMKTKDTSELLSCLQRFLHLSPKPDTIHTQFQPFCKLVEIYKTQALLIAQKRTAWLEGKSADRKEGPPPHQCNVDHQKNGVMRWIAIVQRARQDGRCQEGAQWRRWPQSGESDPVSGDGASGGASNSCAAGCYAR